MTEKEMLSLCNYIAKERNKTIYCPIVINPNLVTMLGRVVFEHTSDLTMRIESIEFSEKLLKFGTKEAIITTAMHELAHAFVIWDTGKPHGHDMYWKRRCEEWELKILNDSRKGRYGNLIVICISMKSIAKNAVN
jgi:hypothetical protein